MCLCVLAALAALAPDAARADCFLNGSTVTCTPPGTGGYQDGFADYLTVNVQSGATVTDSGSQSILVQDGNTITNDGMIEAADSANAIRARTDNIVTNNGKISVVDGNAIELDSNTSLPGAANITNNGTITVTNFGTGIYVGSKHRIVNNGTISAGDGFGIAADSRNVITNYGTISAGTFGEAVQLVDADNQFYNFGTLYASGGGLALDVCSCATGTLVNNKSGGVIDGYINVDGAGNTLSNSGLVQATGSTLQGYPTFLLANQSFSGAGNTFAQTSTGTLALRMDNTGLIDNLSADAIVPGGTVKIVIQPQLYPSQTFSGTAIGLTIYGTSLGNIAAPFDHYTSSSPFFTVTPGYDTGDPTSYQAITFEVDRIPFGSVPGATDNQRAVGSALEPGYSSSLDPNSTTGRFYANLLAATSLGALDQLSGSGTAAAQNAAFGAGGLFNETMLQQGLAWLSGAPGGGAGAALSYAAANPPTAKPGADAFAAMTPRRAPSPQWRAWALGFGSTRSIDGSDGTAAQSMQTAGGAFGVERALNDDLLLGLAAGGSGSHFSVSSLSTSGEIDGGHVGIYAAKRWGDNYAIATVNYARFDNSTNRTITGIGTTENAHGRFASDQFGGRFELGWRRQIAGYAVTPFMAVEPAALWQQAYTETSTAADGSNGTLGLSYAARETTSLPTFLGAQLDGQYVFGNGQTVRPFVRAAWVHEFMPERQIQATLVSIPSSSFTVDGARPARDAARVSGGATWSLGAAHEIFARADSEFSGSGAMVAGTAGARIIW